MGKPDPTPPKETSAASTGTNVSTSIANAFLNNPNEITADGTKTTEVTGNYNWTDPYTNQTYNVPRFTTTQQLSDQQRQIKAQQDAASLNLSTLGNDLSGKLNTQLTGNFKLGNEATESRLAELGAKRLDPRFAQEDEALRTRLSNQGIKVGSTAYDREMGNLSQSKNDAYNQLYLQGRGQAAQESLTEDNQRINQIGALLSGGQVSQPNFLTGFQQTNIPVTDNAGIIANYDKQRADNAAAAGRSIGGLFSGLKGMFALSDERAKEDIKKVGELNGQEIHTYRYKSGGPIQMGLIAQKVEKKTPEAVMTGPDGLKRVNYSKALKMGGAMR